MRYNENMIEHEIIRHEKLKDLNIFINSIRMRSLHMHHDFELFYVLNGKGTITLKSETYSIQTGDTVLINPYESHEIVSNDVLTIIVMQFSNHFIQEYFPAIRNSIFTNNFVKDQINKDEYKQLITDILKITETYIRREHLFELKCLNIMSDILYLLFNNLDYAELTEAEYSKRKKTNRRIDRIVSYINENYQSQLRLNEIAESEGLTTTHLSHIITHNFGMTFQEYLKRKRLECAVRMISDSSKTLSEVSDASGFSELKYMKAAFKETFGLSPEEYRQKEALTLYNNKKATISEYIYSDKESLQIIDSLSGSVI